MKTTHAIIGGAATIYLAGRMAGGKGALFAGLAMAAGMGAAQALRSRRVKEEEELPCDVDMDEMVGMDSVELGVGSISAERMMEVILGKGDSDESELAGEKPVEVFAMTENGNGNGAGCINGGGGGFTLSPIPVVPPGARDARQARRIPEPTIDLEKSSRYPWDQVDAWIEDEENALALSAEDDFGADEKGGHWQSLSILISILLLLLGASLTWTSAWNEGDGGPSPLIAQATVGMRG